MNAQASFTISGNVEFPAFDFPVDGYPIFVASGDGIYIAELITDEEGNYSTSFEIPDGEIVDFEVATFDICTGDDLIEATSNANGDVVINFVVCEDFEFPECQASFWFEAGEDMVTYSFFDDSFTGEDNEITSWLWDFGDGNTSTEQNPTHTYAENGMYDVTLTIVAGDCESSSVNNIFVGDDPWSCGCDAVFEPVCVESPFGNFTFSNACEAECFGFTDYTLGECAFQPPLDCNCGCDIFPVCVTTDDGTILTFPNDCLAYCAGYSPDDFTFCDAEETCECDIWEIDPVCVLGEDSTAITIPSLCWAECMGYSDEDLVECGNDGGGDCGCDLFEFEPVCIGTPNGGDFLWFQSPCLAECAGFTEDMFTECEDNDPCNGCDDVFDPVCVEFFGTFIEFENPCQAECAGFTEDMFTECEFVDPCECFEDFEPVCVTDPTTGDELFFVNICFAECEGYSEADVVECDGWEPCVCTGDYDPVCVETDFGILEYPNACWAECDGFGEDNYVECEVDPCGCTTEYDPVCIVLDDVFLTFSNACAAICNGYSEDEFVDCDLQFNPCACEFDLNIACVEDEAGNLIMYPNACFAECDGNNPEDIIACGIIDPFENCECDMTIDPVCILIEEDFAIPFLNMCWAECSGFTEADIVACDDYFEPNSIEGHTVMGYQANGITATQDLEIVESLIAFPNPVTAELNLDVTLSEASEVILTITNIAGQQISSERLTLNKGQQIVPVDAKAFTPGIYLANLQSDKKVQTIKFVKQ